MQTVSPPPRSRRRRFDALQIVGALWAAAYLLFALRYEMERGQLRTELPLVVLMEWIPIACVIVTFAVLRTGGAFAFLVLGIATFLFFGNASGDMQDAPHAFAVLTMFIGGPCVFMRGMYVYLRPGPEIEDED